VVVERTLSRSPGLRIASVFATLLLFGCDDDTERGTQRAAEPAEAAAQSEPSAIALHMRGRYGLASDLRDAIVRGDLRTSNDIARRLARPVQLEQLSSAARPYAMGIHVRAQEVAEATSLLDASAAFATMMASCGQCHAASNVRLSIPSAPLPSPSPGASGAMLEHEASVRAMWEGLLVGSTERFDVGARRLAEAPLTAPEQRQDPALTRLAEEARGFAGAATRADGLEGRAEQFGLLLSSCAECHATARR
jgi:mono/diheme cytochrome c family protein